MFFNNKLVVNIFKLFLLLFSLAIFVYLIVVKEFDVISEGEGILSINDSNVNILSPSSGIIREINVTRGDIISNEDLLLTIENIEDRHKRGLVEYNVDFYSEEIESLSSDLKELKLMLATPELSLNKKIDSVKLMKVRNRYEVYLAKKRDLQEKKDSFTQKIKNLANQKKILQDKNKLIQASLGNTIRFLDSKLEIERIDLQSLESELLLNEAKSILDAAYNDFIQLALQLIASSEAELRKNKELLITNQTEYATVNDRIRSTSIKSSFEGTVLQLKDGLSPGVYIERNSEIMTLKRDDGGVYVEATFDSKFRPYLAVGSTAKIKMDAPGIKGFFYGEVIDISADSFENSEYSKQGKRYYDVKIAFNDDRKDSIAIKRLLGLKTRVYIVNSQMTFLEYILSVFNKDLDFSVW